MQPPPRRILVIDDCEPLARTVRRLLVGSEVTCVTTVRDALVLLIAQRCSFDVILCDLRMPDGGGRGIHDALRTAAPSQAERMIFMTGDPNAAAFVARCGNACLDKPFTIDTLRDAIDKCSPSPFVTAA